MTRSLRIGGAVAAAAILLSAGPALAGGGGGGGGPCAAYRSGLTMVMHDSCFDGVAHFAPSGATLSVENRGSLPHSFTAVDGSFDTGLLDPGERAEVTLGGDGIVRVVCTLHGTRDGQGMAGLVLVGDPAVAGDELGVAAVLGDHEARVIDAVGGQSDMLAGVSEGIEGLQGAATALIVIAGLGLMAGAAAVVGVWTRPAFQAASDAVLPSTPPAGARFEVEA